MSVGLPGVGLTGLFFIVSALLALPIEIVRTLRRRSSRARWGVVLRQLAIALTMIVVLELAYLALQAVIEALSGASGAGGGRHSGSAAVQLLPTGPLLITLGVLLTVVGAAKVGQLLSRLHARRALARTGPRLSAPIGPPGGAMTPSRAGRSS